MSGLEPLAIAAVIGGGALAATGKIMAGKEQSRAAEFEQQQLQIQEQQTRIAATQDEAKRRNELTSNLEHIQAIRAGRGVGSASPTGLSLYDHIISQEETDIATSRANFLTKAEQSRGLADMAGRKARMSLLSGYLDAGSSLLSTGASAYKIAR